MKQGYYQLPRALFTSQAPSIGIYAKVLYALILDRLSLSEKNGWVDEEGETYGLFAREEMASTLKVSRPTATKALSELKSVGLVREVLRGRNKSSRLYADRNIFPGSTRVDNSMYLSDRKNFIAEGKKSTAEGNKLYTSYINKQVPKSSFQERLLDSEILFPSKPISEPRNQDFTPYSAIITLYHQYCPGLQSVLQITGSRMQTLKKLWVRCNDLDKWAAYFRKAGESHFLNGQNKRGWKADIDFLLSESNMIKVLEGKYDNFHGQNLFIRANELAKEMDRREV